MATVEKKSARLPHGAETERTVIYRGIKIAPMSGKRSATSEAIRDALRAKSERPRRKPTHA